MRLEGIALPVTTIFSCNSACTKTQNNKTKRAKRNDRNDRNNRNERNDQNETTETTETSETTKTTTPKQPKRNHRNEQRGIRSPQIADSTDRAGLSIIYFFFGEIFISRNTKKDRVLLLVLSLGRLSGHLQTRAQRSKNLNSRNQNFILKAVQMIPMNCAMTCGYQFNFLFVVELDVSVFHDMKSMKVIPKPRAVEACL